MAVKSQNHRGLQYFSHRTQKLGSFLIYLCCHQKLGVCAGLAKKISKYPAQHGVANCKKWEGLRSLYIHPSNHVKCTFGRRDITILLFAFAEISPTKRPEEKESCEVWNGWHDYRLADLYCLVPTTLHVFNQICCRHHQQASRCINHNNSRRLSGKKEEALKANSVFCIIFPCAFSSSFH